MTKKKTPETIGQLHPVVDFTPNGCVFSFWETNNTVKNILVIVGSQGNISRHRSSQNVPIGEEKYSLKDFMPLPLEDRWSNKMFDQFLQQPSYDNELLTKFESTLKKYIHLPDEAHYTLFAVWAIGTYLHQLFAAYPFLLFLGPKESGKSQALECLLYTCFNAEKMTTLSISALGDLTEGLRSTVLIDQAENIPNNLVGILADSYKKTGGKRIITARKNGKRTISSFSTFGPKAFASTNALHFDLADRCCRMKMQRAIEAMPDIMGTEAEWLELRDGCYRFAMMKCVEVSNAYQAIKSEGTRRSELRRPLEAVMRVLEAPEEQIDKMRNTFNKCTEETRYRLSIQHDALFQVLVDEFKKEPKKLKELKELKASEILDPMKYMLAENECPTIQWIGKAISEFGLAESKRKRTREKVVHYVFELEKVLDVSKRYGAVLDDPAGDKDKVESEASSGTVQQQDNVTPITTDTD